MSLAIHLLGHPRIVRTSGDVYRFRSRKSWAVLAYRRASALLEQGIEVSRSADDARMEAYGLAMLGRLNLLRADLDVAAGQLDASLELAERDHWLAFLPWPQALQGEVQLARADLVGATTLLRQAFARACQLGDPCWEGMSARGLALVAEPAGEAKRAFETLSYARTRCNRLADPYVWLDGYILDAQCELGRRHGHADTMLWVETMRELASRTGMRELTVRSLLHGAALGNEGDAAAAALLAADIENPSLDPLLSAAKVELTPDRSQPSTRPAGRSSASSVMTT
jgi:hypothetical protein